MASASTMVLSSCAGVSPLSYSSISIKGTKGSPSSTGSITSPHVTHCPTSSIWMSLGRMPYFSASLDSRSCPSQKHSSSSSVICCGIGSYHSSGSQKTLYPSRWKWSLDLCLVFQAWQWISISLKKRSVGRGKRGGEHKATEGHGPPGNADAPATLPSLLPQPTSGHHSLGSCSRQVWPSGQLAWKGNEVRWLQGWLHG